MGIGRVEHRDYTTVKMPQKGDAVVEDMEVLMRNEDTAEGGIVARCQGRVGWNSAPIASHRLSRNADFQILKPPGKDQRCCQPS